MKFKVICTVTDEKLGKATAALGALGIPVIVKPVEQQVCAQQSPEIRTAELTKSVRYDSEALAVSAGAQSVFHPYKQSSRGPDREPRTFVGGVRDKGISGRELILQILDTLPEGKKGVTVEEVMEEFAKHGFAGGSYSAPMYQLVKDGLVVRPREGFYMKPSQQYPRR